MVYDGTMKTRVTLDGDVAQVAKRIATQRGVTMKQVVNEALRTVLRDTGNPPMLTPFRTHPCHMGLQPGISLDNIQELLSQIEGEDAR
jgi:hypothetical protein